MEYPPLFRESFSDCGFESTNFMDKGDNDSEVSEKFGSTDVIYLPEGDPGVLYRELNSRSHKKDIYSRIIKLLLFGLIDAYNG